MTGRGLMAGLAMLALAACETTTTRPPADIPEPPAQEEVQPPSSRPPAARPEPSAKSRELAVYYARVESDLLNRGLLRTDGGGVDTPYTTRDLARNFEQIAFFDEYAQDGSFARSDGRASGLRKWEDAIRIATDFGPTVPLEARQTDRTEITRYVTRLSRVTGHPIRTGNTGANFHVLFASEDDREWLMTRVQEIEPGISSGTLQMIRTLPRSIHCVVAAFAQTSDDHVYSNAIAIIRAEHPDLTRKACIHEELAQGLGLANDYPRARPSIFNDDDEFAFLTTHDEELLSLLYDPALTPGMGVEEARPVVQALLGDRRPDS